jgi:hypothetical protein
MGSQRQRRVSVGRQLWYDLGSLARLDVQRFLGAVSR